MIVPLAVLGLIGILGASMARRKKPTSIERWDDLADSADDLEHATGRLKYELNSGTRQSIRAALSELNRSIARAPTSYAEFGNDVMEKFRSKYVVPALAMKEGAIHVWSDMKALGVKTVKDYREAKRNKPAPGIASARDRESL